MNGLTAWQRYSRIKLAQQRWRCRPDQLPADDQPRFQQQLDRQIALESAVAAQAGELQESVVRAVAQRLDQELIAAGFSPDERQAIIRHHAAMEWRLTQVGDQAPAPEDAEVMRWYRRHADRFQRPEQRRTRHLLLTMEDDRDQVGQLMATLHRKLRADSGQFDTLARRYSHCPTAVEGGLIGWVSRGLLFAELERSLFTLRAGELSPPLETTLGLHLLLCEAIRPPQPLAREEALRQASAWLHQQKRQQRQRQWLRQLLAEAADDG
ncbi:nitrogen fixation protein NifM [Affinibrenneria salicis]|uniref:peptidylprolyl isomerase n=1 Tax=Affinibrenneria salicis TaxID=2590031 RepID=A0A5J5FUC4_9GAMM|nr:nitrogen fixation protein NifM [Affinibrenneria salicis]KAA8996876.1 nitrogen fixation protein NifM [Affinibrenneria salicis]